MKHSFGDTLQSKVLPAINKVGSFRYLVGLKNGIAAIIPFTIIGSLFTIITNLPIAAWTNLIEPYKDLLSVPNTACMGVLSLVAVASIAYQLAKEYKVTQISTTFVALVTFILTQTSVEDGISTANFGSTGLFLAIVVATVTVFMVRFFEQKNFTIKMPESVPTMVADSFSVLIPAFFNIVLFYILVSILGLDLNGILTTIFSPLVRGLDSLPGILLVVLISTLLWCCGINESVISGVTYPVWYAMLAENTAAFEAGLEATHLGAYGFQYFGFWMGGTGCTIGLVLLMLRSRQKVYKDLGRLSFPPAVFNINEPVAFGFPICFNPVMMVPYVVTPLVTTALTYLVMALNIIGRPVAAIPWTTPPVLSGFLVTGGDWRAAVWQVVMLILSICIYYPFFKYEEKQMENNAEEEN